jgi:hypothetical protein
VGGRLAVRAGGALGFRHAAAGSGRRRAAAAPGDETWLRIARRGDRYTAYTSRDGRRWVRGGTWVNALGRTRIVLSAFGGAGHTARFDYARAYRLRQRGAYVIVAGAVYDVE